MKYDLTTIEKPSLTFAQRLKLAVMCIGFMQWILILFMIVGGITSNHRIKGIVLISFAICHISLLFYQVYRTAKTYIIKVYYSEEGTTITYLMKNQVRVLTLSTDQNLFRSIEESRFALKQIRIMSGQKTILKQYALGAWSETDIHDLETQLKRIGFKKPFGENL